MGAAVFEADTWSNTGTSLYGLGVGVYDGTVGVVKGLTYDLPKAVYSISTDPKAKAAFKAQVGELWDKFDAQCRPGYEKLLDGDKSPYTQETLISACVVGNLIKAGGVAMVAPIGKCLKESMNSSKEGAEETGKCLGQAAVLAFATIASAGTVTGGRVAAARVASITERLAVAGRMTPARQAILNTARLKARTAIIGGTAAGETMGLGSGGPNPIKKADEAIEKMVASIDGLVEKGALKKPLDEAQVEKLSKYLYEVANHSIIGDAKRPLPQIPADLAELFDKGRLESWASDVAALSAKPKAKYARNGNADQPSPYQGSAGELAKVVSTDQGPAKARELGLAAKDRPKYERDQFIAQMQAAEKHDRDLAETLAARMEGANESGKKELNLHRTQLLDRADAFKESWQHADGSIEEAGQTRFFERKRALHAHSSAAEASISHQVDLKDAVKSFSRETRETLGLDDAHLTNFLEGEKISDFGKLPEGKALIMPIKDDLTKLAESDRLLNAISGRPDPSVAKSQKAIRELLDEMGHKDQWLMNPDLTPEQMRSVVADAPTLTGYLHEIPGISELIEKFERGVISKSDFQARLQTSLFHNGPDKGFWGFMSSTLVPGSLKKVAEKNPSSVNFFKGTVFDAGNGALKYPPPQGLGLQHAVLDRLSQGTGGGMVKIMRELEGSPMTATQIIKEVFLGNPKGTLTQFVELEAIVARDAKLAPAAKTALKDMIANSKQRMPGFQQRLASRVQVVGDGVILDGKKFADSERKEMFEVFERIAKEEESKLPPTFRLDSPANNPELLVDRKGKPITGEQLANGRLSDVERRAELKRVYAANKFDLNEKDLDVLIKVHEKGKAIGQQDFTSLRAKLSGAGTANDPGYRDHFSERFNDPSEYRRFHDVTKEKGMDTGLLGTVPEPAKPGALPTAASPAPTATATKIPDAPKIDVVHKPTKKDVDVVRKAMGAENISITPSSGSSANPNEIRFQASKGADITDWTLLDMGNGHLVVQRNGRDVVFKREPKASLFNPDLAADLKTLREIEATIKKTGDTTAVVRLKEAQATLIERVKRKIKASIEEQFVPAFEGQSAVKEGVSPNFVVADEKGVIDYSRLPSPRMAKDAEIAAGSNVRFSHMDTSSTSKTEFRVQSHTKDSASDWVLQDRGNGQVSIQIRGRDFYQGKEPQMLLQNADLSADLQAFLKLQANPSKTAAQKAEMLALRDKITQNLPETFQKQVVPTLRGDIEVPQSIQPERAPAGSTPATSVIASEPDMLVDMKEWNGINVNSPTDWARESVRTGPFRRAPHEMVDVMERRAPPKPGAPTPPYSGVPGKYARRGNKEGNLLTARLQQMENFVDQHVVVSEAGKPVTVNPKLDYKLSARSDILTYTKINSQKIQEGVTVLISSEDGTAFARMEYAMPDGKGGVKVVQIIAMNDDLKVVKDIMAKAQSLIPVERDGALVRLYQFAQEKVRAAQASMR